MRAVVLVIACACGGPPRVADTPRADIDFAGIDAWLACARTATDVSRCGDASAATRGGRYATAAIGTFGGDAPAVPVPTVVSVDRLVAAMKAWPDAVASAAEFMPAAVRGGPIHVFVVGNGHPAGDAYAQGFEGMRPTDDGDPIVILNPILIAGSYSGSEQDKADKAFGVVSHELFHVLFKRYRRADSAWATMPTTRTTRVALQMIALDEGVAHFIARRHELLRDGFPRERAEASIVAFAAIWDRLAGAPADAAAIVRSASQGSYWNKPGSITGMLLAYGVFRGFGVDGIREALRCGPGRLVSLYVRAATPDLPAVDALHGGEWIDLCASSSARHGQP